MLGNCGVASSPAKTLRGMFCKTKGRAKGRNAKASFSVRRPFVPALAGEPQGRKPCPDLPEEGTCKKQKQIPDTGSYNPAGFGMTYRQRSGSASAGIPPFAESAKNGASAENYFRV